MLNKIQPTDFFILLGAFVYGNIFALQSSKLNWGFIVIFCVVFLLEYINKSLYYSFRSLETRKQRVPYYIIGTNLVKRGFLLGFFLEAFKVGS